jgi:hypothetical protein
MDAPQSPVEIAPIEQALRLLDDQLRIVWNPMCVASRPGYIDAHGKVSPPVYDGRWEIVRLQGHIDPNPVVVWIWGTELGPAAHTAQSITRLSSSCASGTHRTAK